MFKKGANGGSPSCEHCGTTTQSIRVKELGGIPAKTPKSKALEKAKGGKVPHERGAGKGYKRSHAYM